MSENEKALKVLKRAVQLQRMMDKAKRINDLRLEGIINNWNVGVKGVSHHE